MIPVKQPGCAVRAICKAPYTHLFFSQLWVIAGLVNAALVSNISQELQW